jgi:hypothetical protein
MVFVLLAVLKFELFVSAWAWYRSSCPTPPPPLVAPAALSLSPIQLCRSLNKGDGRGWSLRPTVVDGDLVLVVVGTVVGVGVDVDVDVVFLASSTPKGSEEKKPPSHGSCTNVDAAEIVGIGGNVGGGTTTTFI